MVCLKSCCCCCTLKTGTIIIGCLSIFGGMSYLFQIFSGKSTWENTEREQREKLMENKLAITETSKTGLLSRDDIKILKDAIAEVEMHLDFISYGIKMAKVRAAVAAVALITSILLLVGTIKGYRPLLMFWIITVPIECTISVVCVIFLQKNFPTIVGANMGDFLSILEYLTGIVLALYFLLVVISYFQELKENEMTGRDPSENIV